MGTKRSLAAQIDDLYRLPLGDFTGARNTLAKTLPAAEKKPIASLVKPTLPAWLINQLYWQEGPTYKALIDAAEKLRAAHRAILGGRKTDTRTPDQLHRATVEKAFAKTIALAEKRGLRLTDAVRETVRRTLTALPGGEAAGRLTSPPEPAGFSLLTGVKLRPASKAQHRGPEVGSPRPSKPSRAELQTQMRAQRERRDAERKAEREKVEREREIRKAEQAIRDAERRLAELKG